MKKILIIGATSAIAQSTARIYAQRGDTLFLAGRNEEKLRTIKEDLTVRGAGSVDYAVCDFAEAEKHEAFLEEIWNKLDGVDIVLIAYGVLGNQEIDGHTYAEAEKILSVNFLSVVSFLTILAGKFEKQKSGVIAVISSVAGDRGRSSNYVYGASKGALSIYLQGLRGRLVKSGVCVLTVKPGFVDTPMTKDFKKGLLWASPDTIAKGIVKAIHKKKDIVYLPWFWYWIMCIIKHIPERIFKKLNI